MTRRFVSIGEIMVELAPAGDGNLRLGYAGDTFNTAWYARRLLPADWSVEYVTALGRDEISDDVLAFVETEGIGTAHVQRRRDRTVGLYMIRLKDGERSFSYWRGQSAARCLAEDRTALAHGLDGAATIWFSGITLAVIGPNGRATLLSTLAEARADGATIAFDTNLRPSLWSDAGEMREAITRAAAVADIVLPSFDEEVVAFGDAAPADTIARYRKAGVSTVVVKNGAHPCHAWCDVEGEARVQPDRIATIVDSTAAGDAFGAGFLAARADGASLTSAVESAARLSAQVIGHRGALAREIFKKGTRL